jgi:hypothetical protein
MTAQELTDILDPAAQCGVHDVEPPVPAAALDRIARRHGYGVFRLNCSKVTDKESFLDAAAQAFGLPPHFGRNWDAFRDCLSTMEWRPGNGYVVVVTGTQAFARAAPDEARIVREIFIETAADWGRRNRPFHVLWACASR